jgi:hypothetical protein
MNVYKTVAPWSTSDPKGVVDIFWAGTLAEAHETAKKIGKWAWPDVRVELVDVATDKESVLLLLKGDQKCIVLKTWMLTPRGALTPCPNGE